MCAADTLPSSFDTADLFDWLETGSPADLDGLPFGVIGMAPDSKVERYNVAESQKSGLAPGRVMGRLFFVAVAPCMNNFLVAHRFATEPELDDIIDYVLTFRVAPVNVRLRLMKRPNARRMYIAIDRRN